MAILTLTNIALTLLTLYAIKRIHWALTTGAHLRALAEQHNCLPAPMIHTRFTFGLPFWWAQIQAIKQHRLLPFIAASFKQVNAHTRRYYVFSTQCIMTEDPENIKAMLATNFTDWSLGHARIAEMSSYLGRGIFVNEGPAWKHSRELLRPCFEKSLVGDVDMLERHVQRLFEVVPQDGSEVDLQPLLHDLSMDIATELVFGRSTNALGSNGHADGEVRAFCEAFDYASNPFGREAFKKWGVISLFVPDRFNGPKKRHVKVMQDFVDRIIAAETSSSKPPVENEYTTRYNFLTALLSSDTPHATIRSELLNILVAGRDTVASLLSNILWELPRHPTILSTLHTEITKTCGPHPPTYTHLKTMPYLRAIINESQRLRPIVPMNSRQALTPTLLPRGGGPDGTHPLLIPKGSVVGWHTYSMQRRTDLFGLDADVFRPERWLEPGFRPGWAYVPFSGGPRVCVGQGFAVTLVGYVVARVVQGFELCGKDDEEWREKLSLTCMGVGGCRVGLVARGKGEVEVEGEEAVF